MLRIDFSRLNPGDSAAVAAEEAPQASRGGARGVTIGRDPYVLAAVAVIFSAGLAITGLHVHINTVREMLTEQIVDQKRAAEALAENVRAAKDLQKQDSLFTARTTAIKALDVGRFTWPHILAELGQSVPPGVWLSEIGEARGGMYPVVGVRGTALQSEGVTAFLARLHQSPFFGTPRFIGSDAEVQAGTGRKAILFQIEIPYQEPADSTIMHYVDLKPDVRTEAEESMGKMPAEATSVQPARGGHGPHDAMLTGPSAALFTSPTTPAPVPGVPAQGARGASAPVVRPALLPSTAPKAPTGPPAAPPAGPHVPRFTHVTAPTP
jgi:Tfp pilus assembly protein PilN